MCCYCDRCARNWLKFVLEDRVRRCKIIAGHPVRVACNRSLLEDRVTGYPVRFVSGAFDASRYAGEPFRTHPHQRLSFENKSGSIQCRCCGFSGRDDHETTHCQSAGFKCTHTVWVVQSCGAGLRHCPLLKG